MKIKPHHKTHLHHAAAALHTTYWCVACVTAGSIPMILLFAALAVLTVIIETGE